MRGRQRGLLIGCWVVSDGPPDRPFGTVIPGRPAFSRTVVVAAKTCDCTQCFRSSPGAQLSGENAVARLLPCRRRAQIVVVLLAQTIEMTRNPRRDWVQ